MTDKKKKTPKPGTPEPFVPTKHRPLPLAAMRNKETDYARRKRKKEESSFTKEEEAKLKKEVEALADSMPYDPSLCKPYKSLFPDGTSENDRYSASKFQQLTGKPLYKNKKELAKDDLALALKETPPPMVVEIADGSDLLNMIDDKKLRTRVEGFLTVLLEGGFHKEAMEKNDFTWNGIQRLRRKYPLLTSVWTDCRDAGEAYRQIVRSDAAHQRAVDGVDEPMYSNQGKFLGNKKVYSDRLLEMLLKADSPEKYRPVATIGASEGLTLNIKLGIDRAAFKEETEREAEDAEFETLD